MHTEPEQEQPQFGAIGTMPPVYDGGAGIMSPVAEGGGGVGIAAPMGEGQDNAGFNSGVAGIQHWYYYINSNLVTYKIWRLFCDNMQFKWSD